MWDHREFSEWLSVIYHGTSSGDPYRAGTTLARLRRIFTSPVAAAAFAEQYPGTARAFRTGQRPAPPPPSARRWSAVLRASSTRRRTCPWRSE